MRKSEAHLHQRSSSFVVSSPFGRLHHLSDRARIKIIGDITNLHSLELAKSFHFIVSRSPLVSKFVAMAFEKLSTFGSVVNSVV